MPQTAEVKGEGTANQAQTNDANVHLKLAEVNTSFTGKGGQPFFGESFNGLGGQAQRDVAFPFRPPDSFRLQVDVLQSLVALVGKRDTDGIVCLLPRQLTTFRHNESAKISSLF